MSGLIWTPETSRTMHELRRFRDGFFNANDPRRYQPELRRPRRRRDRVRENARRQLAGDEQAEAVSGRRRNPFSVTPGDPATFDTAKICDHENLAVAFWQLKSRGGQSPGIDGMTYDLSPSQVFRLMRNLAIAIRTREYQPAAPRVVRVPKSSGGYRQLEIPTIMDRVVGEALGQAVRDLLTPRLPRFYGASASVHAILARTKVLAEERGWWWLAVDDIRNFVPEIPRQIALNCWRAEAEQWGVADAILVEQGIPWLVERLIYGHEGHGKTTGVSQGSTFSPLVAAIFLKDVLDLPMDRQIENRMMMHRYVDNVHVQGPHRSDVRQVMKDIQRPLQQNGLRLKDRGATVKDVRQQEPWTMLGMGMRWRREQLMFEIPEIAWMRLDENLSGLTGITARRAVQGFISSHRPALGVTAGRAIGRICRTMTRHGIYTIPQTEVERWTDQAGETWRGELSRVRVSLESPNPSSEPDTGNTGTTGNHPANGSTPGEGLPYWNLS